MRATNGIPSILHYYYCFIRVIADPSHSASLRVEKPPTFAQLYNCGSGKRGEFSCIWRIYGSISTLISFLFFRWSTRIRKRIFCVKVQQKTKINEFSERIMRTVALCSQILNWLAKGRKRCVLFVRNSDIEWDRLIRRLKTKESRERNNTKQLIMTDSDFRLNEIIPNYIHISIWWDHYCEIVLYSVATRWVSHTCTWPRTRTLYRIDSKL